MPNPPSSRNAFPNQFPDPPAFSKPSGMKLKAFLTTLMALLSLLVFGLGYERRDMLWMWVGFICVLVSGVFVQLVY